MPSIFASACLLLALGVVSADAQWMSGVALFSFGPKDNATIASYPKSLPEASCGYGELTEKDFPGFKLAGISPQSELKARAMGGCGSCIEVKCADKHYCSATTPIQTVMIYDTCAKCAAKELNLNARVFEAMVPLSLGRVDVQYRQVACPFKGNIAVRVSGYRTASGGWLQLDLKNVAGDGDITMVELAKAGSGAWIRMNNTYGASWELSKLPAAPYDLRVTTKGGKVTVISSAVKTPGVTGTFPTTAQFKA